jgi:hypothetical protein
VDLDWSVKGWFIIISLAYAGVIGILGGVSTLIFVRVLQGRTQSGRFQLQDVDFLVGAIVWAALVIIIQLMRVLSSLRRTTTEEVVPVRVTFWGLQANWQMRMAAAIWIPGLLAGLLALFRWLFG